MLNQEKPIENSPKTKPYIYIVISFYIFLIAYFTGGAYKLWDFTFTKFFFFTLCFSSFFWFFEKLYFKKYLKKNKLGFYIRPSWLGASSGIFPVVLIIFIVRGFMYEVFLFPTESMAPAILPGDMVLVDKTHYFIREPVSEFILYKNNLPKRGDNIAFRFPLYPKVLFGKRVIGIPGDNIEYNFSTKILKINSYEIVKKASGTIAYKYSSPPQILNKFTIETSTNQFVIIENPNNQQKPKFKFPNCTSTEEALKCTIPPRHYFVMGDNRDYSFDSRFFGLINEESIIGKPTLVITNTKENRNMHKID